MAGKGQDKEMPLWKSGSDRTADNVNICCPGGLLIGILAEAKKPMWLTERVEILRRGHPMLLDRALSM